MRAPAASGMTLALQGEGGQVSGVSIRWSPLPI
jgi:hypothetical protein